MVAWKRFIFRQPMNARTPDTVTTVIPSASYGNEVALSGEEAIVISGESGVVHRSPGIQAAVDDYLRSRSHVARANADAARDEFPAEGGIVGFAERWASQYNISDIIGPYEDRARMIRASADHVDGRISGLPEQIMAQADAVVSGQSTLVNVGSGNTGHGVGVARPGGRGGLDVA